MIVSHPYSGRVASLATRHDKWKLIAPALEESIGLTVVDVDVDTDDLGTFSGELPRLGTPLETAIAKARLGISRSGLSLGLANEGTIGPHPVVPFLVADVEIVLLVDEEFGTTVAEIETEYGIPTLAIDIEATRWEEVPLSSAGFPEHGLIVRPVSGPYPIFKGIHDLNELREAVERCASQGKSSTVRIESDLRAHHHPSRQLVIERAAGRLAQRLACLCPRCGTPGWGVVRRCPGAHCGHCGGKTQQICTEHLACPKCENVEDRDVSPASGVDPMFCQRCNP